MNDPSIHPASIGTLPPIHPLTDDEVESRLRSCIGVRTSVDRRQIERTIEDLAKADPRRRLEANASHAVSERCTVIIHSEEKPEAPGSITANALRLILEHAVRHGGHPAGDMEEFVLASVIAANRDDRMRRSAVVGISTGTPWSPAVLAFANSPQQASNPPSDRYEERGVPSMHDVIVGAGAIWLKPLTVVSTGSGLERDPMSLMRTLTDERPWMTGTPP